MIVYDILLDLIIDTSVALPQYFCLKAFHSSSHGMLYD